MAETTVSMSSEAAGSDRDRVDRSLVSWRPCSSPYLQGETADTQASVRDGGESLIAPEGLYTPPFPTC